MLRKYLKMFWSIIRVRLGFGYSEKPIPTGPYCYKITESSFNSENGSYTIKPCPYYVSLHKDFNGCQKEGVITSSMLFGDQCKICGVNQNYNDQPFPKDGEIS